MRDRHFRIIRVLFAVVLLLAGVTISLLAAGVSGAIGVFAQSLGLGLIVTGCLAAFQEVVTSPNVMDELRRQIDRLAGVLEKPGLRIVARKRRGEPRYYKWVLENEVQEAFFAGHSILHRVDEDFVSRGLLPVQDALRQKVSEGSKIRILFLDPTWQFLDDIAKAGGQDPVTLRRDLTTTLTICKGLLAKLRNQKFPGRLEIRACRAVVQYAFHHVACASRHTDEMLVGFYFADQPGTETPVFETDDTEVRARLRVHFNTIFDDAKTTKELLSYSDGSIKFAHEYFGECVDALAKALEEKAVEHLRA